MSQVTLHDRNKVLQEIYTMVTGNPATYISQKSLEKQLAVIPRETINGCLIFFCDLKYVEFRDKDQFRITGQGILYYESLFKK